MRSVLSSMAALSVLGWAGAAAAAPTIWAIDDGEKIRRDAVSAPFSTGVDNPIWSPGQPIRVSALQNETVAIQIVIGADATALTGVTVDLDALNGPGGTVLKNDDGATDPTRSVGRRIERFVEHFYDLKRPSGNTGSPTESLGWGPGSGPDPKTWVGFIPDALIPVEIAPAWSPYPMQVAAQQNGIVWVDITIPKDQAPGIYTGQFVVKAGATDLAKLPVELKIYGVVLPDASKKTMILYDKESLDSRMGDGDAAEEQLFKVLHRHRLSASHSALQANDLVGQMSALDGTLYTAKNGYAGPGEGQGDGILSLGTYGGYGTPDANDLQQVEGIASALSAAGLVGKLDVFVYADDENCSSANGPGWINLLKSSSNATAKGIPVGWTCSEDPSAQPVNLAIVIAQAFDVAAAKKATTAGKKVWIYNGARPHSGTLMVDTEAVSLRVNGWLQGQFDIERWFYWESTFWYDGNRGGQGPIDPFVTPENFHNDDGDFASGDGMLLYPGKQVDMFTTHSIGTNTMITSIKLKNLRRGIQDAGYMDLARAADAAKTEAIVRKVIPKALSEQRTGKPSWGERGKPFYDGRMDLLALIPKTEPAPGPGATNPDGGPPGVDPNNPSTTDSSGCGCNTARTTGLGGAALALALAALAITRRRLRREV